MPARRTCARPTKPCTSAAPRPSRELSASATASSRRPSASGAEAIHPGLRLPLRARVVRARGARRGARVRSARRPKRSPPWAARRRRASWPSGPTCPVVPGTTEALRDAARSPRDRRAVRIPGAAQGRGGRRRQGDARRARAPARWPSSLDAARREAKNAFGDDAVYVEKYIVGPAPRGDPGARPTTHGTVLSLGERECSVQRRHQKMIEEAPSVAVTPELRQRDGRDRRAHGHGGRLRQRRHLRVPARPRRASSTSSR